MPLDTIRSDCKQKMDKSVEYFHNELRGIRTGRASTALVDHVKVEYYGNQSDLKDLAAISTPEPTKIVVKPFDPSAKSEIVKAIEAADLGLNPMADGDAIFISVPPPSRERRQQLIGQVKKMAEDARVAIRNERRDAIKHIDQAVKDKENHLSEDAGKSTKNEIEDMTKKHTADIDAACTKKSAEIEEV